MKKLLTSIIALSLIVSLMVPFNTFAQEDKALENAIRTAKSVLNITDTYDNFNYSMSKENTRTVFSLSWNDSKNKYGGIHATIDSEGRITNYYSYKPYDRMQDTSKIPVVSKADAIKIANEFIRKVNKSLTGKIEYKDNDSPMNVSERNYYFNYLRIENGILFPQNSVSISVNNRTGEVENFSVNWTDDISFPAPEGHMTMEKAQQTYIDKLGLKLTYKLSQGEGTPTPYLVYTNVYNERSIDAVTGEIVGGSIYHYAESQKMMDRATGASASPSNVILTPEEKGAIENNAKLISQSRAESIARETLKLDSSYSLESINLYSSWQNKSDYIWSIHFIKEDKKDEKLYHSSASISIDAVSGDVLNFYNSVPYDSESIPKFDKDQALKIATDFIKSMQPSRAGEAEYTTWDVPVLRPLYEEPQRQYYFTFTRKSNDIYFIDNGFSVTVDTTTGAITNYNFNWYKGDLPPSDKVISSTEAHKILFDSIGLRLQYIADYSSKMDTRKILPPDTRQIKPDIRLVYAIKPEKPANIDALSGKLLDYAGKPYEKQAVAQYTDIAGSSAESQIKILAQYGISLPGSEFKPDQEITQKEFLYLLGKSTNSYSDIKIGNDSKEDENLYQNLINWGIIKESEKSPTSAVTRQEAAKYIVRALKYDKVAEIKGIYKLPFEDAESIDPELYGYIAVSYGLNIIKDTKGYFKPTDSLTRAQAAVVIYNFLNIN